jgi:hypothetical protein
MKRKKIRVDWITVWSQYDLVTSLDNHHVCSPERELIIDIVENQIAKRESKNVKNKK